MLIIMVSKSLCNNSNAIIMIMRSQILYIVVIATCNCFIRNLILTIMFMINFSNLLILLFLK